MDSFAVAGSEAAAGRGHGLTLRMADASLAEYLRHLARFGGELDEEGGVLLFAGAHGQPNPYRNGALRLDSDLPFASVLQRANEFFAERQRGYVLWASEHGDEDIVAGAASARLPELERLPELLLTSLPAELPPPAGVRIIRATDRQVQLDYLSVVASAWGMASMPLEIAADVFFDPASLASPEVVAFVAYYDGFPLSGAMTFNTHGVALGCQAATVRRLKPGQAPPPMGLRGERRGLAESCLCAALKVSFVELGAELSLCQSSTLGAPLWLELGYAPLTSYARYLVTQAHDKEVRSR